MTLHYSLGSRRRNKLTVSTGVDVIRDRVLTAARRIVEEDGWPALTYESLIRALPIRSRTLRTRFSTTDEVRDALTIQALMELTELLWLAIAGCAGVDALQAYSDTVRLYARARPGMYEMATLRMSELTPEAMKALEAFRDVEFAALEAYKSVGQDAAQLAWCLRAAIRGAIALETSDTSTKPFQIDQNFDRLVSLLDIAARATSMSSLAPTSSWRCQSKKGDRVSATG